MYSNGNTRIHLIQIFAYFSFNLTIHKAAGNVDCNWNPHHHKCSTTHSVDIQTKTAERLIYSTTDTAGKDAAEALTSSTTNDAVTNGMSTRDVTPNPESSTTTIVSLSTVLVILAALIIITIIFKRRQIRKYFVGWKKLKQPSDSNAASASSDKNPAPPPSEYTDSSYVYTDIQNDNEELQTNSSIPEREYRTPISHDYNHLTPGSFQFIDKTYSKGSKTKTIDWTYSHSPTLQRGTDIALVSKVNEPHSTYNTTGETTLKERVKAVDLKNQAFMYHHLEIGKHPLEQEKKDHDNYSHLNMESRFQNLQCGKTPMAGLNMDDCTVSVHDEKSEEHPRITNDNNYSYVETEIA